MSGNREQRPVALFSSRHRYRVAGLLLLYLSNYLLYLILIGNIKYSDGRAAEPIYRNRSSRFCCKSQLITLCGEGVLIAESDVVDEREVKRTALRRKPHLIVSFLQK